MAWHLVQMDTVGLMVRLTWRTCVQARCDKSDTERIWERTIPVPRDATTTHYIVKRRKRVEDVPLLTGKGEYTS